VLMSEVRLMVDARFDGFPCAENRREGDCCCDELARLPLRLSCAPHGVDPPAPRPTTGAMSKHSEKVADIGDQQDAAVPREA
jgi:hypothetical protein